MSGKKVIFEEKIANIPEWKKDETSLTEGAHRGLNKMDEKKSIARHIMIKLKIEEWEKL